MKLVRQEDESDALRTWMTGSPDEALVSSELGKVEVLWASRRLGVEYLVRAGSLLSDIDLVPLDRRVADLAAASERGSCGPSTRCTCPRPSSSAGS